MIGATIGILIALLILALPRFLKRKSNTLWGAIGFMILYFGIRTNYGNDFGPYRDSYNYLAATSLDTYFEQFVSLEPGWGYLMSLFTPWADFQVFIFFLTIVQFGTIGMYFHKFVKVNDQIMAMSIYLFSTSLMIIQLSMLRQSLAMSIVMWSLPFILKRKYLPAILIIYAATFFHRTAWAGFLFLLIPFFKNFNWKFLSVLFIILFIAMSMSPFLMKSAMTYVISESETFEKYQQYLGGDTIGTETMTGLGFAFQLLVAIYVLISLRLKSNNGHFFMISILFNQMFVPPGFVYPNVGRMAYQFYQAGIAGYPEIFSRSRKDVMALAIFLGFMLLMLWKYFYFFSSSVFRNGYAEYHTIFNP